MSRFQRLGAITAVVLASAAACDSKERKSDDAPSPSKRPTTLSTQPVDPADNATFERFPSAAAAVQSILQSRPRVVGFGEYHQTNKSAKMVTSLTRFRQEILPQIAGAATALVLETWVEAPNCGRAAKATSTDVKQTIDRPAETENELVSLLRAARDSGLSTHTLEMTCTDYESFQRDGEVDYNKLLRAITDRLLGRIKELLAKAPSSNSGLSPAIFVYGGGLHNDVNPLGKDKGFSYAARVSALVPKRYVEIDLFVPEFIADSLIFAGQPWYETAKGIDNPEDVLLFKRGSSSFVIVLKSGREAPSSGAGKQSTQPERK